MDGLLSLRLLHLVQFGQRSVMLLSQVITILLCFNALLAFHAQCLHQQVDNACHTEERQVLLEELSLVTIECTFGLSQLIVDVAFHSKVLLKYHFH